MIETEDPLWSPGQFHGQDAGMEAFWLRDRHSSDIDEFRATQQLKILLAKTLEIN